MIKCEQCRRISCTRYVFSTRRACLLMFVGERVVKDERPSLPLTSKKIEGDKNNQVLRRKRLCKDDGNID